MMNMVKKSLQLELNNFFETVLNKEYTITKQAYIEARKKIKPELFVQLIDATNEQIYDESNNRCKKWRGYRLSAIDGTVLEIPDTENLRREFGESKNQITSVARAKACCIYDIENHIVIKCVIDRYNASERELAMRMIKDMLNAKKDKELILLDRGYPSSELMAFMYNNGVDFVMRCSKTYSNIVMKATQNDQIVKISYNKKSYKIRVIRLILDSGEEEILLTSLMSKELTANDFKELYFKRWKIEVKFDEVKNKLQIENFTGNSKITIEQDFYASMYISNMAELARTENDEVIKNKNRDKNLTHEYRTNLNVIIGTLKDKLILMLIEKSPRKRKKMFRNIENRLKMSTIPIRPNRHNPRKLNKSYAKKYSTNSK